jgi:tetratricopeptide (TPR) repeat protein
MKLALPQSPRALACLVVLVGITVYANSLLNGFALDDNFIVLGNPNVHSPESLRDIWLTPYWPFAGVELGLYRPGVIFLYAVQWLVGGGAAWVFHATSIALHAAVSVLVFVLLRRTAGTMPAFVGALVFAVHPVHTEAVSNIVGQSELIAAAAMLAACIVHSGRPIGVGVSWWRRLSITVLFALALTAKESAVVMPALLIIVDFLQRRVSVTVRGFADYAGAMLMTVVLLAATLVFYLVTRYDVMGGAVLGVDAAPGLPFLREEHRVLNALRAFPEFLRLIVFPLDLAADYTPAAILPVDEIRPLVVVGALLLLGLAMLSGLILWMPYVAFPAAWFLITIITVSNLFFPIGVVIAERTLYLPSVAVSAVVAFAWRAGVPRASFRTRRFATLLVTVVILALGARTWIRNPVWASTDTVWLATLRDQPRSYRTQWLYAVKLWRAGHLQEAAARFELAQRLYPRDPQMVTEYANLMMARGQFEGAVPLLESALAMDPGNRRAAITLMHAFLGLERYHDAIHMAAFSRRIGGSRIVTLQGSAFAHQQLGEYDKAIAAWRVVIAHSPPTSWRLHGFLARVLGAAGLEEAALSGLDAARAVLADSAHYLVLDTVERALHDDCYRRAGAALLAKSTPALASEPLGAKCDDLGHPLEHIVSRQNASVSHNAIRPATVPLSPRR